MQFTLCRFNPILPAPRKKVCGDGQDLRLVLGAEMG